MPLLVPHGRGITCLMECSLWPSAILKWPKSLPHFRRQCLLLWSGRSPNDTFRVEVVGELVAEFQKLEEQRPWLERPATRICDLLLGLPPGRA
jgi:hypothetical protein